MKSVLFSLSCFMSFNSFAALVEPHLLVSAETHWVKSQGLEIQGKSVHLSSNAPVLDLDFQTPNPKALLEKGDFSLQRKILLNGSGTEIAPEVFLWDLQLEVNYKFI
jgi:hypothetical protein